MVWLMKKASCHLFLKQNYRFGTPVNPDDIEVYKEFVSNSLILGIDEVIITETIRIRKLYNLKLPDAVIAATCLINQLTLIADNDKDFQKVELLNIVNPNNLK